MKGTDGIRVEGILELLVYRRGELVERWRDRNLVVDDGKAILAQLVAGDGDPVSKVGVGEGTAAPTPGDVGLTNGYLKAVSGHSYPASGQVRFSFSFGTSEANGKTITEFGLFEAGDTLFARRTRTDPIEKDDETTITGTWTIVFIPSA